MKRIFFLFSICIFLWACVEEFSNPTIGADEIKIYFKGTGASVKQLATQGFDVEVGDSLKLELQVSPANEVECKWYDAKDSLLQVGLNFLYKPKKAEQYSVRLVALRSNGVSDSILFKLRGIITGLENSEYGKWKEFAFPEVQTGEFDTYFTITTNGDQLNSAIGLGQGSTTTYANLSCIIRFNMNSKPGIIDVFKGDGIGGGTYNSENATTYEANTDYKFKVSSNIKLQKYSVFIEKNGTFVPIATDYSFRAQATKLSSWSLFSDGAIRGNGTISLKSKSLTTISQNKSPLFEKVTDLKKEEGAVFTQTIKVTDPAGGVVKIKGKNLPRFATLTDNGNNTADIRFAPYVNCGGCDIGTFPVVVEGSNIYETSELTFNVEISAKTNKIILNANVADGVVYDQTVQAVQPSIIASPLVIGKGPLPGSSTVFAHSAAIIPFQIPTLESGMKAISAKFSVNVELNNAWKNVRYDLYALPARTAATILNSDYYMSGTTDATVGVSLIQSGFVVNNMVQVGPVGTFQTDATAATNLATYINNLISNAPAGSKYFFLRVNPNRSDLDNWIRLNFSSAESPTAPTIEITFGPK